MSRAEEERIHIQQGRKVGFNLYPTLSEDHQAIIANGMTPKELIDSFEAGVRDNLARIILERQWLVPEEIVNKMESSDLQDVKDALYKHVIEEYNHGFVLGLMDAATKVDKMLV